MSQPEQTQIYLITPSSFEPSVFGDQLAAVLDRVEIACVRLDLASQDAEQIARAADHLRPICHQRDIALVISRHFRLVERLGLDGCHLPDGARQVREVRKALGPEAILGSYCAASRHAGLSAGEAGADYISFGPLGDSGLGDGTLADRELFQWWSEMIELPVVAEGGLSAEIIAELSPVTDFLAIGAEIWGQDDPAAALSELLRAL